MGEMRDRHCGGCAAVFVQEDYIGESGSLGGGEQVRKDEIPTVQSYRCWEKESDLFAEGCEPGGRTAGGCDQRSWVSEAGKEAVFIVDALLGFGEVLVKRFVVFVVFSQ